MFSACTARALTWLLLALRRIDHHGIRCLHGLRLPLEHLRRQPGGGAASARPSAWFGLGALQFWQRKARRDEPVAHHTPHPADPGGGCLRASRLLRSLRGFEHAIANGAASAAATSEAQPQEEGEDVSDERRRSIASVTTAPDDDHLASSSSALALPEAVRHGHALWLAVLVSTEMGLRRWAATPAAHDVVLRRVWVSFALCWTAGSASLAEGKLSSSRAFLLRQTLSPCSPGSPEAHFRGSRPGRRCSLCAHPPPLSCTLCAALRRSW